MYRRSCKCLEWSSLCRSDLRQSCKIEGENIHGERDFVCKCPWRWKVRQSWLALSCYEYVQTTKRRTEKEFSIQICIFQESQLTVKRKKWMLRNICLLNWSKNTSGIKGVTNREEGVSKGKNALEMPPTRRFSVRIEI